MLVVRKEIILIRVSNHSQQASLKRTKSQSIKKKKHPIECVPWHGALSGEGEEGQMRSGLMGKGFPVVSLRKPRDMEKTPTFVTRLLILLFAEDSLFRDLQKQAARDSFPCSVGFPG